MREGLSVAVLEVRMSHTEEGKEHHGVMGGLCAPSHGAARLPLETHSQTEVGDF